MLNVRDDGCDAERDSMAMSSIEDFLSSRSEEHIERIAEVMRQPSVFNDLENVRKCAEVIKKYLELAGFHSADLMETDLSPLVVGEYDCRADQTVLVYTYFDTMPAEAPEKWIASPYSGKIVQDLDGFGRCLVGKGVGAKGATVAFLNAMEAWIRTESELPFNVIFVCEGEEMWGSPHISWFVEKEKRKLSSVDALFYPNFAQSPGGNVQTLSLGGKGFVGFELECSGASWGRGPTKGDIHSSTKAVVDSPMWRLIHAISTMTGADGSKILIDGFYDDVVAPDDEEEKLLSDLAKDFDADEMKQRLGVNCFIEDIEGEQLLRRHLYSPTLNIEGIPYTSIDPVGVVSHVAKAKFQSRIVRNQSPEKVLNRVRSHLDRRGYKDIAVRNLYGFGPGKTSVSRPIVQAILKTYKDHGLDAPKIWPSAPASSPTNCFNNLLGIPVGAGGLGRAGRSGGTEYLALESRGKVAGIEEAELSFIEIMKNYAELSTSSR